MASPQLENGFTRIANELLEAILRFHCSGGEKDIILAVIRLSYGYGRKAHEMSVTYLARLTRRHRNKVAEDLARLIAKRVLVEVSPASFSKGRMIALNKNYDEWVSAKPLTPTAKATVSESTDGTVSESADGTVSESADHIKKNSKKELKKRSNTTPTTQSEASEEIKDRWNGFAEELGLTKILKLSGQRKSGIKQRLSEKEFDLNAIFAEIRRSPFLQGENERGWKVDFDWLFLHTGNYLKVLEGRYRNQGGNENGTTSRNIGSTGSQYARATFHHGEAARKRLRDLEATLAERDRERSGRARPH